MPGASGLPSMTCFFSEPVCACTPPAGDAGGLQSEGLPAFSSGWVEVLLYHEYSFLPCLLWLFKLYRCAFR